MGTNKKRSALSRPITKEDNPYITAIFVDIEDSTGIANYLHPEPHRDFLKQFHLVVRSVLDESKWKNIGRFENHKFLGDEFIAFFPRDMFPNPVSEALELAAKLKFRWYFSNHNEERLSSDKEPTELNIGINSGAVTRMPYPVFGKAKGTNFTYEGFPITVAKRVQGVAEEGRASRIILADTAFRDYARESKAGFEFHYLGKKHLKGMSQTISCYEWLGTDLEYLDFSGKRVEETLQKLYDKNRLNPWFAGLLINYYYQQAEKAYYKAMEATTPKKEDKLAELYGKTAGYCLGAIQNITWSKLRNLSALLLACLEVQESWPELGYRAEQAFNNDPTFAYALALRAKALLEQSDENKSLLEEAKKEADRVIRLFDPIHSGEDEALFLAHFVQAAVYADSDKTDKAMISLEKASQHAKKASLAWAVDELDSAKDRWFKKISKRSQWETIRNDLKRIDQ